jgi:8-oxo-dGTP diphosphatase
MKPVEVVAAIMVRGGLFFCAQRGGSGETAGAWEFPGGKIEAGESPEQALRREISEELRVEIEVGDLVARVIHRYRDFELDLRAYAASIVNGGDPELTEHLAARWLSPSELLSLDWAPADLPIAKKLAAQCAS